MSINLLNGYSNGSLRFEPLYVEFFDMIPDTYSFYQENLRLDTKFLTREKCNELFGNVVVIINQDNHIYSTSRVDGDEIRTYDIDSNTYKDRGYPSITIINQEEKWIVNLDYNSIRVYSHDYDNTGLVKRIIESTPKQEIESKTSTIDLVAYDHNYYTINSKIKHTNVDFDTHYNDGFKEAYEKTLKFLDEQESGIIIWHGEKGSGKTSAIRHLLSNTDKRYILVTNAIAAHMAEPEFIAFMMEHKDSVFILEDCEQILTEREENRFGGAIANILNMSDGLMSDIFNIKFICTFNTDINNIDKALLRPGRCFVNYEFKALNKDKSVSLLESLGHTNITPKEYTLAEIYNFDQHLAKEKEKKHKTIGF